MPSSEFHIEIQHKSGETKGQFYVKDDHDIKAKITYSKLGATQIIIDHTEVSGDLKGQGVGKMLVEHAVEFARKNDLKVIPLCPFAKTVIESNSSLQDVLKK